MRRRLSADFEAIVRWNYSSNKKIMKTQIVGNFLVFNLLYNYFYRIINRRWDIAKKLFFQYMAVQKFRQNFPGENYRIIILFSEWLIMFKL